MQGSGLDDTEVHAKLKLGLAEIHRHDGDRCAVEKRHFVDAIIEKASGKPEG